jgi:hypothetical protein
MSSVAARFQSSLKEVALVRDDCRRERPKLPVARLPDGVLLKRRDSSPSMRLFNGRLAVINGYNGYFGWFTYGDRSTMAKGFCLPSAPTALSSTGTAWSTIGILMSGFRAAVEEANGVLLILKVVLQRRFRESRV